MKIHKIIKIFISIFIFICLSIFTYSRILQAQVDESQRIFDDMCNNINPTLIAYKNSYLQMWNLMKSNGSENDVMAKMQDYINGIKKYIPLENTWLKKDSVFIDRWDFQLFQPTYMKNLAKLQIAMYQAQRDDAQGILNLYLTPQTQPNFDLAASVAQKVRDTTSAYFAASDAASKMKDWRKLLWREPPVDCPEQNLNIPQTDIQTITATPTPTPIMVPSSDTSLTS